MNKLQVLTMSLLAFLTIQNSYAADISSCAPQDEKSDCQEKLNQAIQILSTMKSDKGLSGSELANYLIESKVQFEMADSNSPILGLVKHFDATTISLNCSVTAKQLAYILAHETFHHIINKRKTDFSKDYLNSFTRGLKVFETHATNEQAAQNFTDQQWKDYFTFMFDTLYNEMGAYQLEGSLGDPQFSTAQKIHKQLNDGYVMPKFKFSLSFDTYEELAKYMRLQDEAGHSLETQMTNFRNNFINLKGDKIINAIKHYTKVNSQN